MKTYYISNIFPRKKTIDDVPKDELFKMSALLYIVGRLVWDYTDTVLDIAYQVAPAGEVKKLSRTIREIQRRWNTFRLKDFDSEHDKKEFNLALLFEELTKKHLHNLCPAVRVEVCENKDMSEEDILLIQAVMEALTVYDAMKMYASQCDKFIKAYYPTAPHSIMPDEFVQLARLIPRFAGNHFYNSDARRHISNLLLDEINGIDLVTEKNMD